MTVKNDSARCLYRLMLERQNKTPVRTIVRMTEKNDKITVIN